GATTLAVWRQEFKVFHTGLADHEARALMVAREGGTLEDVCATFAGEPEPAHAAFKTVLSWFADGWVAAVTSRLACPQGAISTVRLLSGCTGRALCGYFARKEVISGFDTASSSSITIHCTSSLQGGVVSEPAYAKCRVDFGSSAGSSTSTVLFSPGDGNVVSTGAKGEAAAPCFRRIPT